MKLSSAIRAVVMLAGVAATLGCNQERPVSPSAPSLFIPNLAGVWSGPMTLQSTSGGECTGQVVGTFLPATDRGTISITQTDADTSATLTMESSGLACRYTGTASLTSLAMNAVSCDRTGLVVACLSGQNRELKLVGSSIAGSWIGDQVTGQVSSTYNVFTIGPSPVGVGSLIATHNFAATRR
jgi:hypothetical protein